MKKERKRGEANFTEAREAEGRSPEREVRREIRAGRVVALKVGTARFTSRMALRAGGQSVRLLHGRGAQASRLCMAESEATSSTGLALHCSTRPGRPCPILKQQGRPRRQSGTPTARHPYPFISKGAAAPLVCLAIPIVSFPSFDSLAPARSPFGPTYGCSISYLPSLSSVHSVCSVVKKFFHLTNPKNSL